MFKETITIQTRHRTEFTPISSLIQPIIRQWGVREGICTLYVPHTTAGIFINEGYDPDVMRDVERSFDRQVPWEGGYSHMEGNAAAHIKAIMAGISQQILVENGVILLGQWQEIFYAEFDGPRTRKLIVSFIAG